MVSVCGLDNFLLNNIFFLQENVVDRWIWLPMDTHSKMRIRESLVRAANNQFSFWHNMGQSSDIIRKIHVDTLLN